MCGGVNTNRIGFKQLKVITSGGEDMVVEGAGDWNCILFFFSKSYRSTSIFDALNYMCSITLLKIKRECGQEEEVWRQPRQH